MKKFLSFVIASALLTSSLGMVAFAADEPDPQVEYVSADITVKLGKNGEYEDTTEESPYQLAANKSTFDAKAVIDMDDIADTWNSYVDRAMELGFDRTAVLSFVEVTDSEFVVKIQADEKISNENPTFTWSSKVNDLFEQVGEPVINDNDNSYTLTMKVKDDVTTAQLDEFFNAETREILSLEVKDNSLTKSGTTYKITSTFSGKIEIGIAGGSSDVDPAPMPSTEPIQTASPTLRDEIDGYEPRLFVIGEDLGGGKYGEKDVDYIRRKSSSNNGGTNGGGTAVIPVPTPTTDPVQVPLPTEKGTPDNVEPQISGTSSGAKLNYNDHIAYINGYDNGDGTTVVRPENPITRAEVATIFYRILDEASRNKFKTAVSSFSDVSEDKWFNTEVSTVAAAGIVNGYEDGSFMPDKKITRAEFAAIASRFTSLVYEGENMFTDTSDHWAANEINNAAMTGWIAGYEDGTFNPEADITRAEAITIINRMLYRFVSKDGLHDDLVTWSDNTADKWYYEAVQEATNEHNYNRRGIGYYETHID